MDAGLRERFLAKAGLSDAASLIELVEAVRAIPYGRPSSRSLDAVVDEWTGTCSTKHALLADLMMDRCELELVHRVYRVTPELARARFGDRAAAAVPVDGLVDVHTFAVATVDGRSTRIDVTFPATVAWDGGDMELACGPGTDHATSDDPWAQKDELVAKFCDPDVREPFIAALSDA